MNTNDGVIYHDKQEALKAGVRESHLMMITPTSLQARRMKVGRNEPCPCGSGLKFKKCHWGRPVTQ